MLLTVVLLGVLVSQTTTPAQAPAATPELEAEPEQTAEKGPQS